MAEQPLEHSHVLFYTRAVRSAAARGRRSGLHIAGGDVLAGAQTGTGKTAGFVLPMLQQLSTRPSPHAAGLRKPLRALILTPTRELAAQVEASIKTYGRHLKITSMVVFGGVGLPPQTARS